MKLVLVVGVGALGSHVVQFIRNVPEVSIRVVDNDSVDHKNVLSQFHSRSNVGRSKTSSISQMMQFLFGSRVETIPHRLVKENSMELVRPASLVIDCLDNAQSRVLLQMAVRSLNVPCLHGALAADGAFGRVVWDETFAVDEEDEEGATTCEAGDHLPFIGVVSSYLALAAHTFLIRGKKINVHIHPAGAIFI